MARINVTAIMDGDVDAVWAIARDFNGLPGWHPFVESSRIEDDRASDAVSARSGIERSLPP